MEKLKICSVKVIESDKLKFNYEYPNIVVFNQNDKERISIYGERICEILYKYIHNRSEDVIFTSYFDKNDIQMDIDSSINKKLKNEERQSLADISAFVLKVVFKNLGDV
ncbi:hypothetical protein [Pseudobacteroides cellulosolvens]|uniref:Uncharacterized protein n=1 Tax=Pseudobacteroides cellulosolvens ATCC 35603 = DSM 2933 TaxID=398512 RepID=A0A0L6JKI0_9FIRM|nr:hypothetical protein [Pseudobacteroides cellulosolvens]KNY26361.1 hypothetical protein Bccel_1623 [Pseudobacteroides cellulosolvens ATCC 35603 = DSM 2933]